MAVYRSPQEACPHLAEGGEKTYRSPREACPFLADDGADPPAGKTAGGGPAPAAKPSG